jgi:transcriptional antiterminator NusG
VTDQSSNPIEQPTEQPQDEAAVKHVDTNSIDIENKPEEESSEPMQWYILKVQSNREDSIREGLQRRVAIAGLEKHFGNIIVPIEKVTEVKGGKKRIVKRKLYPGYLVVQMEITEDAWFLVRETPGIGDFTGAAGKPTPMQPHEVARILSTQEEETDQAPKLKISFKLGDRVKINEGTFENIEGEVESIDETNGRVTVMINIFGRSTPVELEYWQIEAL